MHARLYVHFDMVQVHLTYALIMIDFAISAADSESDFSDKSIFDIMIIRLASSIAIGDI